MDALRKLKALSSRFVRAQNGVAAVEFAIAVPIMLALYLGSVEASTYIILDRKVQTAASALGDLVARTNGDLSNNELRDYFHAVSGIIQPYQPARLQQTLLGVAVATDGKTQIKWVKHFANGAFSTNTPFKVGSSYNLPIEFSALAADQTVIVAKVNFTHDPMFGMVFDQTITLSRDSFHMPRTSNGVRLTP